MMDLDGENMTADQLTAIGQLTEKMTETCCYAPLLADRWLRSEVMSVGFAVATLRYSHNERHDMLRHCDIPTTRGTTR